jgi:hypothetical protein
LLGLVPSGFPFLAETETQILDFLAPAGPDK